MRWILGLSFLVPLAIPPSHAGAQQVVQLEVELPTDIVTVPAPLEQAAFKAKLAEELRKLVSKHLPFWEFQLAAGAALPRLTIAIVNVGSRKKPESWGAIFELRLTDANNSETLVGPPLDLFGIGQVQTFIEGDSDTLLTEIPKQFGRSLLRAKSKCLEGMIKLPLVDGAISALSSDLVEAVLPLKWERFGRCATSDFRISFVINKDMADEGIVTVYSKGKGVAHATGMPPTRGIVVRHHHWQHPGFPEPDVIAVRLTELVKLKQGRVLFDKVPEDNPLPDNPDAEALPNP